MAKPTELTPNIAKLIGDNFVLGFTTPTQNPFFYNPFFLRVHPQRFYRIRKKLCQVFG